MAIWNRRPIESSLRSRLAEAEAERDSQRDPTSLYESGYKRGFELGKRLSWERFMPKIDSALAEAEDERIECSRRAERAEARVVEIEAERAETEAKLAAVERRNGELVDWICTDGIKAMPLTPAEIEAATARRNPKP